MPRIKRTTRFAIPTHDIRTATCYEESSEPESNIGDLSTEELEEEENSEEEDESVDSGSFSPFNSVTS